MPWSDAVMVGTIIALSTLFSSSQRQVHAKDISGCCTRLLITSDGDAINHQSNRVGEYLLSGIVAEKPMYKHIDREEYLFYLMSRNKGLWMVGPKVNQFNGGLAHRGDKQCVEDVVAGEWKYTDGKAWHVDPTLKLTCLDRQVAKVECTYRDGVQFVGGDLPEEFGGGGIVTASDSSSQCIQECENREGCQYWSWVERDGPNCYLKFDKVRSVRVPKYVSGSIPSACISGPGEPNDIADDTCSYPDVEFMGGDLYSTYVKSLEGCRDLCAAESGCQLFTFYPEEEENCHLKSETAQAKVSPTAVSGSVSDDCKNIILPDIDLTYEKNQINGKFKMDMKFRDEYRDPETAEYKKLAGDIEKYLLDMLEGEPSFAEQAVFDVNVVSFTPGSVVCNFKVNYILREAYLAVPFKIKPTNITTAMNKNFKFRRGILFQKFLIVAGSFKSSSPVDHCAAKGCSHKCDYDYGLEDYVCTCPPTLVLNIDEKTCVEPGQEDVQLETSTTINVSILPSDCLWSAWSSWSNCNCATGQSERTRTIAIPAKNGGVCSGRYKEVRDCDSSDCAGLPNAEATTGLPEETTTPSIQIETEENVDVADTATEGVTFGDKITTEGPIMTTEGVFYDDPESDSDDTEVVTEEATEEGEQAMSTTKPDVIEDSSEVFLETTTMVDFVPDVRDVVTTSETESDTKLPEITTEMQQTSTEKSEISTELSESSTEETETGTESSDTLTTDIDIELAETTTQLSESESDQPIITELPESESDQTETSSNLPEINTELPAAGTEVSVTEGEIVDIDTESPEADTTTSSTDIFDSEDMTTIAIEVAKEDDSTTESIDATTLKEVTSDEPEATESSGVVDDDVDYDEISTEANRMDTTSLDSMIQATTPETLVEMDDTESSTEEDQTESTVDSTTKSDVIIEEISTPIAVDEETTTIQTSQDTKDETVTETIETTSQAVDEPEESATTEIAEESSTEVTTEEDSMATEKSIQSTEAVETTTFDAIYDDDIDDDTETPVSPEEVTTESSIGDEIYDEDTEDGNETTASPEESVTEASTESYVDEEDSTILPFEDDDSSIGTTSDQMDTSTSATPEESPMDATTQGSELPETTITPGDDTTLQSDKEIKSTDNDEEVYTTEASDVAISSSTEEATLSEETTISAIDEEMPDTKITFPKDDGQDEQFTTTTRTELSSDDQETTISTIIEGTEPSINDIPSLSQTKDSDSTGIDENMITDTPRSFPDNTDVSDNTFVDVDAAMSTTPEYVDTTTVKASSEEDDIGSSTTMSPQMVTVVSVEEDVATTIIVTTIAPVTSDSQDDQDMEATTLPSVTATDSTSAADSTTTAETPIESGEHEFDCEELAEGDLNTSADQIPMKCTQLDGSTRRRVYLVISKSQVNPETLFAKNVKVVVKDLMVMDISPEGSDSPAASS
eukprot:TRINITY_DN3756_c0_g1_i6.p1 TRINITY_DN3756_c0_g1~~TRINITY_DN3756_c0_g1_i6.p1  ORF type:complete len:1426 (+),score=431.11 TRINITY_DN3756_c0_g1_i6:319-4596(+)